MNQLTNNNGFGLAMAVWLAHDDYDAGASTYPGKQVVSVTSLLKPTRQFILNHRVPNEERTNDVADFIHSRGGHAIHDSIEGAWRNGYAGALKKLGFPNKMIDKIRINPETVSEGDIPVYLEQRYFREFMGIVISGKFDQIINGELNDTKTTSVFTYLNGNKNDDYQLQLSLYRWICPDKVTSDVARIQHYFTDWQGFMRKTNPNYPKHPIVEKQIQLLSLKETEQWIRAKFAEIEANQDLEEHEMIRCSDADLWRSEPEFKYYADPKKAAEGGRSTKNFTTLVEANAFCSKQQKGVVVTNPSKVKACSYCAAFDICSQQLEYEGDHERS